MTNSDDLLNAPERIWLAPDLGDDWHILKVGDAIYWEGVDDHHPDDCETEYVRADIAAARIRELEAELEETVTKLTHAEAKLAVLGLRPQTHVIVPVEQPTIPPLPNDMVDFAVRHKLGTFIDEVWRQAFRDAHRAFIRAAQEGDNG